MISFSRLAKESRIPMPGLVYRLIFRQNFEFSKVMVNAIRRSRSLCC